MVRLLKGYELVDCYLSPTIFPDPLFIPQVDISGSHLFSLDYWIAEIFVIEIVKNN